MIVSKNAAVFLVMQKLSFLQLSSVEGFSGQSLHNNVFCNNLKYTKLRRLKSSASSDVTRIDSSDSKYGSNWEINRVTRNQITIGTDGIKSNAAFQNMTTYSIVKINNAASRLLKSKVFVTACASMCGFMIADVITQLISSKVTVLKT